jgi:DNA-binding XRE family transcriptional regulator
MKNKHPLDIHVGSRVKMQRMLRRMKQQDLADALDLSFQQVQKYEKGASRIGAARLQIIARTLGVPVAFFFEGGPTEAGHQTIPSDAMIPPDTGFVHTMVATADGLRLARAFTAIGDTAIRRQIVDVVESMAQLYAASDRES